MDASDYGGKPVQPHRSPLEVILNILTGLVLILACCLLSVFAAIFLNPKMNSSPFSALTLPAAPSLPTSTPLPQSTLPLTWTPTPFMEPTSTETPAPTATTIPASPTAPIETQPAATPEGGMPFVLHAGDPVAIPNIGHPDRQCNWIGVAGKAFDMTGAPIAEGLFVQLGGIFNGAPVDMLGMTGMASQYGPGGYEFTLGEKPQDSTQMLWLQLFDQAKIPLSDKVYFDTFADCDKNLILVNFDQVH